MVNYNWLKIDTVPPHWDSATHLMDSLNYYGFLSHFYFTWDIAYLKHFIFSFFYYPPLVSWLVIPWYLLFGKSADAAAMSNIVFIFILIFSTYGIGKKMWNRKVGLLAALLVSVYPVVLDQSKEYMLDLPLTAMVALSFYCLLKTEGFKNLKFSIIFGIAFSLGMLTKWTFAGFMLVPTFLYFAKSIYDEILIKKEKRDWRFLINVMAVIIVFLAIAGPWYAHNLKNLLLRLSQNVQCGINEGDPPILTWASFRWYFWALINNHLYLINIIPLVFGLGFLVKIKALKKNWLIISTVVISYIIFAFFRNKDVRFIMPILSFLAVLSCYWIEFVPKKIRLIPILYLILVSIFMFFGLNFGFRFLSPYKTINLFNRWSIVAYAQFGYINGWPRSENWPNKIILEDIVSDAKINFPKTTVKLNMYYVDDEPRLNKENFKYNIMQNYYPIEIRYPLGNDTIDVADYFLVRSSDQSKIYEMIDEQMKLIQTPIKYLKINQYSTPMGDMVYLFREIK